MRRKLIVALVVVLFLPTTIDAIQTFVSRIRVLADVAPPPELTSGDIVIRVSGSCGAGFTEVTALANTVLRATTVAAGDVGGTGGSDTITPAGTVSQPTFTGDALGSHAHSTGTYATSAHSGTAVADHASHTHTYTDVVNHTHVQTNNSATTGGLLGWGAADASTNNAQATGYSTQNPAGGVATGTTNGPSATLTHSVTQPSAHTLSGSSESVTGGTPAGTVSTPTFTGTQFDNKPAFTKVILCQKN